MSVKFRMSHLLKEVHPIGLLSDQQDQAQESVQTKTVLKNWPQNSELKFDTFITESKPFLLHVTCFQAQSATNKQIILITSAVIKD